MAYTVAKNAKGRFVVTNPAGKAWKTTYPSSAAADKAVSYIQGRFGDPPASSAPSPSQTGNQGLVEPEHLSTQDLLDMEAKGERGARTVLHLRNKESSF